ncbi:hypothetical protein J5H56_02940 [Providencia rettgeri]|uniref:hypothetical protein n=1 Tax=Providencia rettgeri TaxID=587 RepID=UPI0019D42B5B|nr:hypothetical protein [Providencia rettgeri]MBN7844204.1 hypothetical protein [Providencia rettgeri]MBN7852844.1 hypothetical protein [Providencia rettgeri]MBN7864068.1 hypothetical protein [Providencia rettgeri]MBN7874332.1 hypothetical protein [Providencia rettgeri]MBN7897869.1 hypothetical protein [Providencia rettgeri]
MADIYDAVIRNDLHNLNTDELKAVMTNSEEASQGLTRALRTIGKLTFHALNDEEFSDKEAKEHLSGLSDLLMYLPRIINGIQQNATTAKFELSRREG